jgi:hypothetical protein
MNGLNTAFARAEELLQEHEYDDDQFSIVVELYHHDGQMFAHTYINATVVDEGGEEGSMSGDELLPSTIASSINDALDHYDETGRGGSYE